jgi:hypothetical protein
VDVALARRRKPATGESFCLMHEHTSTETASRRSSSESCERRTPKTRSFWSWTEPVRIEYAGVDWPDGIEGMRLPAYSPELNPAERWFEELRAPLSNRIFETVEAIEKALTEALRPFWDGPEPLASLTGYDWWVENISTMPTS